MTCKKESFMRFYHGTVSIGRHRYLLYAEFFSVRTMHQAGLADKFCISVLYKRFFCAVF